MAPARKIEFTPVNCVSNGVLDRNKDLSAKRGLPEVGGRVAGKIAVVGGGPSAADHLQTLKDWDGEIWAINGAWRWCRDNGIKAVFFSVDPDPVVAPFAEGVENAILSDICDASVFDAISGRIEIFPYGPYPTGSTTACAAPMIAALMGAPSVTFFGVESSFKDKIHVYSWGIEDIERLLVRCGGEEFLTTPQFIMQAEYLSEIARGTGDYIRVMGEGFLPSLVKHGDYEVTFISRSLMETIHGSSDIL